MPSDLTSSLWLIVMRFANQMVVLLFLDKVLLSCTEPKSLALLMSYKSRPREARLLHDAFVAFIRVEVMSWSELDPDHEAVQGRHEPSHIFVMDRGELLSNVSYA